VLKILFKDRVVPQYDVQFKHGWCAPNCIRLNKVITFTETTTAFYRAYKLHDSCIKLICTVEDL